MLLYVVVLNALKLGFQVSNFLTTYSYMFANSSSQFIKGNYL